MLELQRAPGPIRLAVHDHVGRHVPDGREIPAQFGWIPYLTMALLQRGPVGRLSVQPYEPDQA